MWGLIIFFFFSPVFTFIAALINKLPSLPLIFDFFGKAQVFLFFYFLFFFCIYMAMRLRSLCCHIGNVPGIHCSVLSLTSPSECLVPASEPVRWVHHLRSDKSAKGFWRRLRTSYPIFSKTTMLLRWFELMQLWKVLQSYTYCAETILALPRWVLFSLPIT
jgi:hypothetical protein